MPIPPVQRQAGVEPQNPAAPDREPPPAARSRSASRRGGAGEASSAGPVPARVNRSATAGAGLAALTRDRLDEVERCIGMLAQPFGRNMNPTVRAIAQGLGNGSIRMDREDRPSGSSEQRLAERRRQFAAVADVLGFEGIPREQAEVDARRIVRIAEAMDVKPAQLAERIVHAVHAEDSFLSTATPQRPLLVSGAGPESLERATRYLTALMAQGVKIDRLEGREPGLQTTAMNSDIDGPFAASYGQQGIDVEIGSGRDGPERFHVRLPAVLPGPLVGITAESGPGESARATVHFRVGGDQGEQMQTLSVEVTPEQHRLLRGATPGATKLAYVEGLSARFFSEDSVKFWQQVSKRNAEGAEFRGNVKAPSIVFNTFGSHGTRAYENPAELVTSFARSVQGRTLPKDIPKGIVDAPHVRVYSGGTTLNENGEARPIGLSEGQQAALARAATQVRALVDSLSNEFGLSSEARQAWHSSVFANPDIPSIILPDKLTSEMHSRTGDSDPGKTLADLQRRIEADLAGLEAELDMGGFVKLHHTPSAPGDTVAFDQPAGPAEAKKEFTTEWQFAVKSQKAMPVLDAVVNDLQRNFGIDLKAQLASEGHSYESIRKMSLDRTVAFFADFVRAKIEEQADGRELTPHVIVPVDTYYEKRGKVDGSDASLIRAAAALYTPQKTVVFQVDTGGGQETVGRSPLFSVSFDKAGHPQLNRHVDADGKRAVDPHGTNAALAPTFYVRSAEDMGKIFNAAYAAQSPITAEELEGARRRA